MGNFRKLGVPFLISFTLYAEVYSGTLSFCDGPDLIEKSKEQCGTGISFGEKKPDCICVNGIYRFIADTCETADGFAEKVCTKITDESGLGASIVGVKFTKDPINWNQAGVVCDRKGFGSDTWDFITERHSRGATTKSENIYSVNGKGYITKGHYDKQAFCVEPSNVRPDEKICRYLKSENENIWQDKEIEVFVKDRCNGSPLVPHKCFGVLTAADSECQLECSANPQAKGRGMQGRGVPPSPKKSGATAKNAPVPPPPEPDNNGAHPVEYWKHDNKFLNRKMMVYNIISQLNGNGNGTTAALPTNGTSYGEPKRTFEIFDKMKQITTAYCPAQYVAPDWINLAVEMFYILHKGNVFRYDENLSPFEYEWIKDILSKCQQRVMDNTTTDMNTIKLAPAEDAGGKGTEKDEVCNPNGGGKAGGYCNDTTCEGDCHFKPIKVDPDRANDSYHYVPEVAWDILDLMQVVCFKEFNESYRMFHIIEQAAEKLFTLQIKNLWYYPNWTIKTKKRLLGNSADVMMHNLEVCIYSAYELNGQIPRLVRPPQVKYLRKKRSTPRAPVSQGQYVDVYCGRTRKDFIVPNCPA